VINPRVEYLTMEIGPMDESEAQISKDLISLRNVHKVSHWMKFSGTKTLKYSKP
jgi:hypothetical protein